MRSTLTTIAAILLLASLAAAPKGRDTLRGQYLEARTASVFAGPCHYNGELVTTGREAIMGWNITSGTWKGVNLAGARAAVAITADANLSEPSGKRQSELVIDKSATDEQATAMADALRTRYGKTLGEIVSIRRADVTFASTDKSHTFTAAGLGSCEVQSLPNSDCCNQPHLVWYSPLLPVTDRKVGYTVKASYTGSNAQAWERNDENSAFYGAFVW